MKAVVDRETCRGCGLCAETCPEVFEMDGLLEYYVTMTNGTSKCQSRVRWTRRSGRRSLCGIAFTHRAEDEDNPLAMTINRYSGSDNGRNRRYHGVGRIHQ